MSPDVAFPVALAGGVAGLAVLAAGAFTHVATVVTQRRHDEPAVVPESSPVEWRACHHPACGHLETPHDPSPVGLACRYCTARTEAL